MWSNNKDYLHVYVYILRAFSLKPVLVHFTLFVRVNFLSLNNNKKISISILRKFKNEGGIYSSTLTSRISSQSERNSRPDTTNWLLIPGSSTF